MTKKASGLWIPTLQVVRAQVQLAFWFFAGGICMFLSIDHVAKGPLLEISLGLIWLGVAAGSLGLLGSSPAGL